MKIAETQQALDKALRLSSMLIDELNKTKALSKPLNSSKSRFDPSVSFIDDD